MHRLQLLQHAFCPLKVIGAEADLVLLLNAGHLVPLELNQAVFHLGEAFEVLLVGHAPGLAPCKDLQLLSDHLKL